MLQGISNTFSSLPIASIGCTAAGLFIGKRFCTAAFHKAGSIATNLFGSKNASEWSEASKESFTLAKKDGIRDLTAAAGLIAIGLASGRAQEKALPKEEPGYIRNYGLPAGVAFIGGSIGWILKRNQVLSNVEKSITPQMYKNGTVRDKFDLNSFITKV